MSCAAHLCGWNRCPEHRLQALLVEYNMHRHQLNLGETSCLASEGLEIGSLQGDRLDRRFQSLDEEKQLDLEDHEHNYMKQHGLMPLIYRRAGTSLLCRHLAW